MPRLTFEFSPEQHHKLKVLTGLYDMTQSRVLECLVEAEWQAQQHKPRLTRGGLVSGLPDYEDKKFLGVYVDSSGDHDIYLNTGETNEYS